MIYDFAWNSSKDEEKLKYFAMQAGPQGEMCYFSGKWHDKMMIYFPLLFVPVGFLA